MKNMKGLHMVAFLLTVIGAINWGLVGLLGLNIVAAVLGSSPTLEKLVYVLVGISGAYLLVGHKGDCKICSKK